MNEIAIYVNDTETTGLSIKEHDIIECSFFRLIPKENGVYEEEQRTWLIKAINPKTISDEALSKNGHKREDILHISKFGKENYLLPEIAVEQIDSWIMEDNVSSVDRYWIGQNPKFDIDRMIELFERCKKSKEDFPFFFGASNNRIVDVKEIVALFDIILGKRRKYYNLSSLVKSCGIKKGKAHRGDEDTRMTKDLLLKLISIIKESVELNFKDCYLNDDE